MSGSLLLGCILVTTSAAELSRCDDDASDLRRREEFLYGPAKNTLARRKNSG